MLRFLIILQNVGLENEQALMKSIQEEHAKILLLKKAKEIEDKQEQEKVPTNNDPPMTEEMLQKERARLKASEKEFIQAEQHTKHLVEAMMSSPEVPSAVRELLSNYQGNQNCFLMYIKIFF